VGKGQKEAAEMAHVELVVCPHCWSKFPPADALWISEHSDLMGDPRLGPEHPRRFRPDRFDPTGAALDFRNFPCRRLACPQCHLEVPHAYFEAPSFFISVVGAPACGKSYFLTSMTWRLRAILPKEFALLFSDAHNLFNRRLQEYEAALFLHPNPNALVNLPKTEVHGDIYFAVLKDGQPSQYLIPFVFKVSPAANHPLADKADKFARVLTIYDNAGESYLPGQDSVANPVTRHLGASDGIFFLFDPLQDVRFRKRLPSNLTDKDVGGLARVGYQQIPLRQEVILHEMLRRTEMYRPALRGNTPIRLIVVVTKLDIWAPLLDGSLPWVWKSAGNISGVATSEIEEVSRRVQKLLEETCPEVVGAALTACPSCLFIPVSSTGTAPEMDPASGQSGFRPAKIRPMWVEVPILYCLSHWAKGLVGTIRPKAAVSKTDSSDGKLSG